MRPLLVRAIEGVYPRQRMTDIQQVFDWLVDGAPGASGPAAVVQRLGDDLVTAGIPIERIAAFVRTLHPHIMGRRFTWKPNTPVEVTEASYEMLRSPVFLKSPIATVFADGKPLRGRLAEIAAPSVYPLFDDLAKEGFTDYFVGPLTFLSGQVHAISFGTKALGGFTDEHIAAIQKVLRPLSRVAEILALSRTAVTLLNTYVGHNAGERIIAGNIQLGDTDTIRAAIWFSDLRGFTELAGSITPVALIGVLNDLFACQVRAIEAHGGEVLKFMGDGLLAIFPIEGSKKTPGELCDSAFAAAVDAFAALAALNARVGRTEAPIRFGLALHFGDVAYGNIGGAGRLDFTCIGPAVNVAARLEGLTGRLERPVVASAEVARLTSRPLIEVGAFDLKGVTEKQKVFAPAEGQPLASW